MGRRRGCVGEGRKVFVYQSELYTQQFFPFYLLQSSLLSLTPHTTDKSKEDYGVWSLYLVFLAVTLPDLAFKPDSTFLPSFEGWLFTPSTPCLFNSSSLPFSISLLLPFSSLLSSPPSPPFKQGKRGVEDGREKGNGRG